MASTVTTQQQRMTRRRIIIIGVLTGIVILFVLFSPYGVITRWSLERDYDNLVDQQRQITATGDSLRGVVRRLRYDTLEIERIARERYGYVREGEEVYLIDRDTTEDQ
ncbi:MAG: septum formation initiator family protein [Candidatus Kapabacteria bacterium]|nr:septum formation initiator family protein [Candidatus Kapabacteria bacterium]